MKIRSKLFLSNLVVGLIAISVSFFFVYELITIQSLVNKEIPSTIQNLSNESYLDSLAQFIKYYDEVLTQSARNYAFTGDKKWKDRYNSVVGDLDAKIKDAIAKGGDSEKKFFQTVNDSNNALVALEEKSFSLVEAGKKQEAINVLDSKEYSDQKKIYSDGLTAYLNERGFKYQQALTVSTGAVKDVGNNLSNIISRVIWIFLSAILIGAIIIFIFAFYFSKIFTKSLLELKTATQEIIKGDFNRKVKVESKDEFKDLADSFNKMAEELKENKENVEQKVKDKTKDLETINKYMVGRELKMIELKKQINNLEKNK